MSMLTARPGDSSRRRADAKRHVRAFVDGKPLGALFCAADVARDTSVPFTAAATRLDALVAKGVIVAVDKPGDARRFFKRVAGRDSR
jgi:hypothetical protein